MLKATADSALSSDTPARDPGPLDKMRESAAHAVEGVKLRLHLGARGASAEQRTGGSAPGGAWEGGAAS